MEPPLGTEAGRKATHDFLSLYSSSAAHNQQDLSSPQGMYLRTHDFLQPLERVEQNVTKKKEDIASVDRPSAPVEHTLPGGIGTHSISYFNQMVLNPEGGLFTTAQPSSHTRNDENSNCSSYSGGSFTLWDESATKKGKTGKENIAAEAGVNVVGVQCTPFLEKSSHSSPNHRHNAANFSSFSSPQPSSSQKNQSFMDMMTTSAMNDLEEEEEDEEEISIKKEPSPYSNGKLSVKVEAKTIEQKPNTPRSKHSATEQRRRSKINDRFHKLREIIPNSEQKRDKASFLLEVIDYIQFLQEKVNRYESSYNVRNQEPSKIMHAQKKCHIDEGLVRSDGAPAATLMFGKKLDEGKEGECPSSVREGVQAASKGKSKSKRKGVVDKKMSEEEVMSIDESGRPSVYYSQGVLNRVKEALGRSGVDVSEASICVEIHLGKRESSQG